MRSTLSPIIVAIILVAPLAVVAQSLGNIGGVAPAFTVLVDPQYPTPHSQAKLTVLSSTLDLANSTMAVSISSKEIYRGSVQTVAVPLGNTGSTANVRVTIFTGGTNYSQTLSIQPQDVALIVEPISSAPPLYPGKSSVPFEGNVRIVAVANLQNAKGVAIDPSSLSYTWTVDDTQIANASGIGKDAIIVDSPLQYRSRSVSVIVKSNDGNFVGGATMSFSASEPFVRIYKNDPLLGILYDHAISGSYAIAGAEEMLYAAPFSMATINGAPLLQWFLNGEAAQTGNSITLRPSGNGEGTASLSLVASTGESTRATENLSLSFGSTSGFSLFGL
ncbi:MAG: hypothetical protein NTU85_00100 [Candidatus Kaiserbacteria bacterium]|nr:hypothetical protein [Candidatus Kaiserbacteria bacterium]